MNTIHEIGWLPLDCLVAAGGHRNRMGRGERGLVGRHIAATGCYEPLIVRPLGEAGGGAAAGGAGRYEILHGQGRAEVLRELGWQRAACLVWPWSEREALLWRATVQRVGGRASASERLGVLRGLLGMMGVEALAPWVLEDRATLAGLGDDAGGAGRRIRTVPAVAGQPEAFTVFLTAGEKRELEARLAGVDGNTGRALMRMVVGK